MPPLTAWYQGRAAVLGVLGSRVLRRPGRLRMTPTAANAGPAVLAHIWQDGYGWHPHAVHVPTITGGGIAHIAVFLDPATCRRFDAVG